jgi:hypothetical protein
LITSLQTIHFEDTKWYRNKRMGERFD